MPHNATFTLSMLYSHFRPEHVIPGFAAKVSVAATPDVPIFLGYFVYMPVLAAIGLSVFYSECEIFCWPHPRTFIVIGLLGSSLDPAEVDKQQKLF